MGLGTDICGSIRYPAGVCGVYGYKPCTRRVVAKGIVRSHRIYGGFKNITTATGPIGNLNSKQ